ncbi:MAG TPA: hypothetical protein DEF64_02085 [Ruminococcaceae bacterium]|jgi:glycosyltransferase involved in cell wall biosynthesis|nr:hypothetical protein [Oscillospiraceae bacterium]
MSDSPIISVLIPVYNSAEHLRLCMNSLINQSFEDYEIIAVNNGSEDNSLEILEEYAQEYPDKVFVYTIEHSNFVGTGRNYGISKARGQYLYICDSDDIVEKHALTWLHGRAEYYKADVVYGYFNFVNLQNNTVKIMGRDGERAVTTGELILTGADYWRRLYKKSLIDEVIEKVGPIPENTNFDDVAWLPVVHSYAKVIRSADRPIYNYFRRTQSTVGGYSPNVVEYSIISEQYAMDNCNPKYREYAELYVARRIKNNLISRWIYTDKLVEQIKKNWDVFSKNKLITGEKDLYNKLSDYNELADEPMPETIYLNGFGAGFSDDDINSVKEKAFNECNCVVLNESNCDVNKNRFTKEAYKNSEFKLLGAYFALENIYENGGIYITKNIDIERPFNSLRYFNAFFAYKNITEFSEEIFGGIKGNPVIKSIINTFVEERYKNIFMPLGERITNIICVKYGVKMNGTTDLFSNGFALLGPSVTVADTYYGQDNPGNFHVCSHNYKDADSSDKQYITLEKASVAALSCSASGNVIVNRKEDSQELQFYKNRVSLIEQSGAYRLAVLLGRIGNKLKVFKWLGKKLFK